MLRMTSYVVLGFDCISSFARRGLPGGSQMVKNLPAMRETQVQYLGQEIPWRRKWQLTPIFLQRIPRTEEPGALQSMGSQRVGHDWVTNTHTHTHTHTHTLPFFFLTQIYLITESFFWHNTQYSVELVFHWPHLGNYWVKTYFWISTQWVYFVMKSPWHPRLHQL